MLRPERVNLSPDDKISLTVECPYCGVPPGILCCGRSGTLNPVRNSRKDACHPDRYALAKEADD